MNKSIYEYEKATDKNIITKQVVINTPTSAHLLPITADEKVIDKIQQALNELERLKKQEKLLELYEIVVYNFINDGIFDTKSLNKIKKIKEVNHGL